MKKKWLLFVLIIYAALLCACTGEDNKEAAVERGANELAERLAKGAAEAEPSPTPEVVGNKNSTTKPTVNLPKQGEPNLRNGSAEKAAEVDDGRIVRQDPEGLVKVEIIDGEGVISFDLDKWNERYNIYGLGDEVSLQAGNYPIMTRRGKIKDVCISVTADFGIVSKEGVPLPVIMLLIEDGTLEFLHGDALNDQMDDAYMTNGVVLWLKNIEAISCEETWEGIDDYAFFATDADGVRYNASIAAGLSDIFGGCWEIDLDGELTLWSGHVGTLYFIDDEMVEFIVATTYDVSESYIGNYKVVLSEGDSSGYREGIMLFDLELEWDVPEGAYESGGPRSKIEGAYFAYMAGGGLNLVCADGDALYNNQYNDGGKPRTEYEFMLIPYSGEYDYSSGYSSWYRRITNTICAHPEVAKYLEMGMSARPTGEEPEIEGEICYEIALGTQHDDQFVQEMFFAVNHFNGQIFCFDPIANKWYPLAMG